MEVVTEGQEEGAATVKTTEDVWHLSARSLCSPVLL